MRRILEITAPLLAAALALGVGGCMGPANAPWLPAPRELDRFPYGSSTELRMYAPRTPPVRGELIALDGDSVFVLTEKGLVGVACGEITRIALQADRKNQLSTPSMFLGWPRRNANEPRDLKWEKIRPFARFPLGLPDSLDRASLQMPPVRKPTYWRDK